MAMFFILSGGGGCICHNSLNCTLQMCAFHCTLNYSSVKLLFRKGGTLRCGYWAGARLTQVPASQLESVTPIPQAGDSAHNSSQLDRAGQQASPPRLMGIRKAFPV